MVLPYVLPLVNQARTLAQTLVGNPTPVLLPAMPIVVKTPACPLVVAPPGVEARGAWRMDREDESGCRALFVDESGGVLGFALSRDECSARHSLAAILPPVFY